MSRSRTIAPPEFVIISSLRGCIRFYHQRTLGGLTKRLIAATSSLQRELICGNAVLIFENAIAGSEKLRNFASIRRRQRSLQLQAMKELLSFFLHQMGEKPAGSRETGAEEKGEGRTKRPTLCKRLPKIFSESQIRDSKIRLF